MVTVFLLLWLARCSPTAAAAGIAGPPCPQVALGAPPPPPVLSGTVRYSSEAVTFGKCCSNWRPPPKPPPPPLLHRLARMAPCQPGNPLQQWQFTSAGRYPPPGSLPLRGATLSGLAYVTHPTSVGAPIWLQALKTDDQLSPPTAISCEQAGLICTVGSSELASDSELGLTEVVHIGPERRKIFIGSPSIWKFPNGTILASHDYFTNCRGYPECWDDASQKNQSSGGFIDTANGTMGQRVQVFRDDSGHGDAGARWKAAASVPGMYWATLWAPPGAEKSVYLMGVSYGTRSNMSIGRSIVIAHSTDYGRSFAKPVVLFSGTHGRGFSGAPTPNLIASDGRVYRAFESGGTKLIVMTKAPFSEGKTDLLNPGSWEIVAHPLSWNATQYLPDSFSCPVTLRHPKPVGKTCFNHIQEGNAVEVNGTIFDILRQDGQNNETHSKAVVLRLGIDPTTKQTAISFVKAIDFPSTGSKFTIRQEPPGGSSINSQVSTAAGRSRSRRFYAITNQVTPGAVAYANQFGVTGGNMALGLGVDAVGARNQLVLASSIDAVDGVWEICDTLLSDDSGLEFVDSVRLTGFQYVDWIFDGDDILYCVRASYRGSNTYHNANRLAVKRIRNFASACAWREPWETVGKGWCRPTGTPSDPKNYTALPPQLSDKACAALCAKAGQSTCKGWANGAPACVLYPSRPVTSEDVGSSNVDPAFSCHRLKSDDIN